MDCSGESLMYKTNDGMYHVYVGVGLEKDVPYHLLYQVMKFMCITLSQDRDILILLLFFFGVHYSHILAHIILFWSCHVFVKYLRYSFSFIQ